MRRLMRATAPCYGRSGWGGTRVLSSLRPTCMSWSPALLCRRCTSTIAMRSCCSFWPGVRRCGVRPMLICATNYLPEVAEQEETGMLAVITDDGLRVVPRTPLVDAA